MENLVDNNLMYRKVKKELVVVSNLEEALIVKRRQFACVPKHTKDWKQITEVLKDKGRKYTSIDEIAEKAAEKAEEFEFKSA
ncbi:hypothetical protein FRX31_019478 [Thalictrum thalictroides]|uniref:Uncharacterized protein n=1 Tax=Thalictrum thalictroides TaxID=46969 RepID=A0A7J6W0N7_THATH|nr:hypothetical protein FRX31_019478 [Thalictrum thalictroides]